MILKRILICAAVLGLSTLAAQAQVFSYAKIYVCSDANGQVTLQNLNMRKNCHERVVRVSASVPTYRPSSAVSMSDPQPAAGALLAGTQVQPSLQKSRDASRVQILMGELGEAQQRLMALQTEAGNPSSARLNGDLKKNLTMAQANVDALKREIAQAKGTTESNIQFVFN